MRVVPQDVWIGQCWGKDLSIERAMEITGADRATVEAEYARCQGEFDRWAQEVQSELDDGDVYDATAAEVARICKDDEYPS